MNGFADTQALPLLRLIVELRDADIPSNAVYLAAVSEYDHDAIDACLALLEAEQLICWSARGEQWTPTLRGLAIALNLPSFELGKPSFASSSSVKVA
ncbi:MAG: hypothetical protein KC431_08980 [Myxococcales bacterium]|nr:hypothetical protein [Myxococcales bacterium]